jgi:hypothetical protein
VPLAVRLWQGPLKWLGNAAMFAGILGAAIHFVRFGRKAHVDHATNNVSVTPDGEPSHAEAGVPARVTGTAQTSGQDHGSSTDGR